MVSNNFAGNATLFETRNLPGNHCLKEYKQGKSIVLNNVSYRQTVVLNHVRASSDCMKEMIEGGSHCLKQRIQKIKAWSEIITFV